MSVTVLLEGEEESGSPSLAAGFWPNMAAIAGAARARLRYRAMGRERARPSRRVCAASSHAEVVVHGPSRDLHSGMYGGPAINPIRVLAHLLDRLHDENGKRAHSRLL